MARHVRIPRGCKERAKTWLEEHEPFWPKDRYAEWVKRLHKREERRTQEPIGTVLPDEEEE